MMSYVGLDFDYGKFFPPDFRERDMERERGALNGRKEIKERPSSSGMTVSPSLLLRPICWRGGEASFFRKSNSFLLLSIFKL